MASIARVVLPGYPCHVTQRGNCRQGVFFGCKDYEYYLELIAAGCRDSQTIRWEIQGLSKSLGR